MSDDNYHTPRLDMMKRVNINGVVCLKAPNRVAARINNLMDTGYQCCGLCPARDLDTRAHASICNTVCDDSFAFVPEKYIPIMLMQGIVVNG